MNLQMTYKDGVLKVSGNDVEVTAIRSENGFEWMVEGVRFANTNHLALHLRDTFFPNGSGAAHAEIEQRIFDLLPPEKFNTRVTARTMERIRWLSATRNIPMAEVINRAVAKY